MDLAKQILLAIIFIFVSPHKSIASKLELRGEALIEVTIFKIDVYTAKYYTSVDKEHLAVLDLHYLMDVKKSLSIKGWKEGFKKLDKKKYGQAMNWIFENTISVKEGDIFSIKVEKDKVSLILNKNIVATSTDPNVRFLAHYPWVGERPIDKKVKNKLLGK